MICRMVCTSTFCFVSHIMGSRAPFAVLHRV
jgi:hypothetical protein